MAGWQSPRPEVKGAFPWLDPSLTFSRPAQMFSSCQEMPGAVSQKVAKTALRGSGQDVGYLPRSPKENEIYSVRNTGWCGRFWAQEALQVAKGAP